MEWWVALGLVGLGAGLATIGATTGDPRRGPRFGFAAVAALATALLVAVGSVAGWVPAGPGWGVAVAACACPPSRDAAAATCHAGPDYVAWHAADDPAAPA